MRILQRRFIMYEFTTDCLTGIEQIDNEHRELFTLINQSIKMISETDDINAIAKNLIAKLKDYASNHFKHEEEYMESIHDPELEIQKKEHAAFTKKISSFEIDTTSDESARTSHKQFHIGVQYIPIFLLLFLKLDH